MREEGEFDWCVHVCVCVHVWEGGYIHVRTCINVIVDLIIRPHKFDYLKYGPH